MAGEETGASVDSGTAVVEVMSQVVLETSPVTVVELTKLIEEIYVKNQQLSLVIDELGKKTSKYKFIGQTTVIEAENNVSVTGDYAALWDVDKDGYISMKVKGSESSTVLITVFWIYVD